MRDGRLAARLAALRVERDPVRYAADPDGKLEDSSFFYKRLPS